MGLGLCKTLLKTLGNLTPYPKFWKWGLPSFSSCSLATQPASPSVFHQLRVGSAKSRTQVRSSQASSWYQRLWCRQPQGPVWLWGTGMGLLQTAMPPTHTAVLMKPPSLGFYTPAQEENGTRWPLLSGQYLFERLPLSYIPWRWVTMPQDRFHCLLGSSACVVWPHVVLEAGQVFSIDLSSGLPLWLPDPPTPMSCYPSCCCF